MPMPTPRAATMPAMAQRGVSGVRVAIASVARVSSASPNGTTWRAPKRSVSQPPAGMATAAAMPWAARATPASRAPKPRTCCRKSGTSSPEPNRASAMQKLGVIAAGKGGWAEQVVQTEDDQQRRAPEQRPHRLRRPPAVRAGLAEAVDDGDHGRHAEREAAGVEGLAAARAGSSTEQERRHQRARDADGH